MPDAGLAGGKVGKVGGRMIRKGTSIIFKNIDSVPRGKQSNYRIQRIRIMPSLTFRKIRLRVVGCELQ